MTSMISRDDLEAGLWKFAAQAAAAGGRINPWMVEKQLRDIDKYAIISARQKFSGVALPSFEDPYEYIGPGKYDLDLHLARCSQCEKIKILNSSNFLKEARSPCGFRLKCKLCRAKKKDGTEAIPKKVAKKYKCRSCTRIRSIEDFPEAKKTNPLLSMSCNYCTGKFGWRHAEEKKVLAS